MKKSSIEKPIYLTPTLSFEMEECAHLHPQGGTLITRDTYWMIKDLSKPLLQVFLRHMQAGASEEVATNYVTSPRLRLCSAVISLRSRKPSLVASSDGTTTVLYRQGRGIILRQQHLPFTKGTTTSFEKRSIEETL